MYLTTKQVAEETGYAYNTIINRLQFQSWFPRPIQLVPGGKLLWEKSEIDTLKSRTIRANPDRKGK